MSQISIIIPFNKGKKYLEECFESLNKQIIGFEVILILNGLTENIERILEKAKFPITIKEFEEEVTVSKARNTGIKLSKGEYIYFLDSDDYFYKDSFNNMINIIELAKNNIDMVLPDIVLGNKMETFKGLERLDESDEDLKETLKNISITENKNSSNNESIVSKIIKKDAPLNDISILNILIKKEIITKNNLKFDESLSFYCDIPFTVSLLDKTKNYQYCCETIYLKRKRDDPINLPSLNQEKSEDKFNDYMGSYKIAIKNIKPELKLLLDKKMMYEYSKSISKRIEESEKWRKLYFNKYSQIGKEFSNKSIRVYKKREIKALKDKDFNKLKKYLKFRLTISRIRTIMFHPQLIKIGIYVAYLNKKPINPNLIIFESFRGEQYSDSPKYIYEYLYKNYRDKFEFVWIMNNRKTKIPGNPKIAKRFSLKYYYYMATSKYWVNNLRHPKLLEKRKNQKIIQTWHGTPLKCLGLDINEIYSANPQIKLNYVSDASKWDYLISPSAFTTEKLRSSFMYTGKVLEYGYPRNDILYTKDKKIIENAKSKLNLPKDKKIILYAPTWRDDEFYGVGQYKFQLKLELDKLKKELSNEYIVLIRVHYFIADNLDLSEYKGFLFDASNYDDIAELYLISDILITDYSSVFFDYANLKRPILFYTYDLDKYQSKLRGFYIDVNKDLPGPLLFTTEEVINSIKNIKNVNEEYKEKYNEFYNKFCYLDDSKASERVSKEIFNLK